MQSHRLKLPIKIIIITVIPLLAVSFIIWYLGRILTTSNYFKIKDIIVNEWNTLDGLTSQAIDPEPGRRIDLSYLKGKNIFSVDLKKEAMYIAQAYPVYRKVSLTRILPDRVAVRCSVRKPFAYVKLYRYFSVDEDLVLFDMPQQLEADLPVISGLEAKIFAPKPGKKYDIKELTLALDIVKEIGRNKIFDDYKIRRINLVSPSDASVFMLAQSKEAGYSKRKPADAEGLEVKVGQGNIKDKVNILASLFAQEKNNLYNIKYIDLRFKEPVIKLVKPQLSEQK